MGKHRSIWGVGPWILSVRWFCLPVSDSATTLGAPEWFEALMHVLHAISQLDPRAGGPQMFLRGMSEAQIAVGMRVTAVGSFVKDDDMSMVERLRNSGVDFQAVGPATGFLRRHPDLIATVDRLTAEVDVVHVHGCWEELQHQAACAARRHHRPYLMRPCGMLGGWALGQKSLKKKIYMAWRLRRNLNRASAIHFTTEQERQTVKPLKLRAGSIVEPGGVDFGEFEQLPAKGTFRRRYPQIGDRPLVVFLGRVHPGKGLEYLVPAMAQVKPAGTMLAVVGPDSRNFQARIESVASQHGLEDRVIFTGMLKGVDRIAALVDADLFSLPSDHENFGVVVVEALAAGTPVVISDQVSLHDEISRGGVGSVVPTDPQAVAEQITYWLSNDAKRAAAAARARPFVRQRFDWIQIAKRWQDHYQRLTTE